MSKKAPNTTIGTCQCPYRNCELQVPVFRFRATSEDPARQRHAGKLYLQCPVHRRSEDQEWILEHADIAGDTEPTSEQEHSTVPAPKKDAPKKDAPKKDEPKKDEPKKDDDDDEGGFGFF